MEILKGGLEDIIVLFDTSAVNTAVLIGDDINGYRYYSSNGTGEGRLWGSNVNPDVGEQTYSNLGSFVSNFNGDYNYSRFVRIKTTPEEDAIAHNIAKSVAGESFYSVFGSSCIDVPQEVIKAVFKHRGERVKGDNILIPNRYLKFLNRIGYGSEETI